MGETIRLMPLLASVLNCPAAQFVRMEQIKFMGGKERGVATMKARPEAIAVTI